MFILTTMASAAFATNNTPAPQCDPYIQFNHSDVVEAHPYGEPNLTVQFGNTGGKTCYDVSIVCHITNSNGAYIDSVSTGPFNHYDVRYWTGKNVSGVTIGGQYGIDLPPGQNHNISFQANVHDYDERVVCKLRLDGKVQERARLDIEIIPC